MPDEPLQRSVLARLRDELGDADTMRDLLSSFLDEAPQLLARMRTALAAQDAPRFHVAAHTLKGLSATFGAQQLAEVCRDAEQRARAGDMANAPQLQQQAEDAWQRVRPQLEAVRDGGAP
ncbi:MAG: Hpt domain-containing protein [Halobacteriales archaeon]|nr:Hpt domain-containing protein [Halobacteriales archaeon]